MNDVSPDPRTACRSDFTLEGGSLGDCPVCGSDDPHVRAALAQPEPLDRLLRIEAAARRLVKGRVDPTALTDLREALETPR